jgi:hypothetical protein
LWVDQSGAVVPHLRVTLLQAGSDVSRVADTNATCELLPRLICRRRGDLSGPG